MRRPFTLWFFSRSSIVVAVMVALIMGLTAPAHALEPSGIVRGVIHKVGGGLLVRSDTNITVELYDGDQLAAPTLTRNLVSADYGSFEIAGVPAGRYAVKFVSHTPSLVGEWWGDTRRASERAFIEVTEGGVVDLPVELSSTAHLSGSLSGRKVAFAETGEPITITATSGDAEQDAWLPYRTTLGSLVGYDDQTGTYSLFVLPGAYDVTFVDTTGAHAPSTIPGVVVAAPETRRDVVLSAAWASISGSWSLRTPAGLVPFGDTHPFAYQKLFKWSAADATWHDEPLAGGANSESAHFADRLDAGRYKFAVSYQGALTFWGGGDLQTAPEIVLASGQTLNGIDVTVDDPATVSGVIAVRSSDGTIHPIASGLVAVWRKDAGGTFQPVPGALRGSTTQGYTTGDGVFTGELAAGTYVFRFWRRDSQYESAVYYGGSRLIEGAAEVTVGLSERRDLGTIVLPDYSIDVSRIAGADRFSTAVAISQRVVPDGQRASVVYLTNAYNFPDALAAGPAAAHVGGLILPVASSGIPDAVIAELKRLHPRRVVLAGGTSAISDAVRTSVKSIVPADATIVRLGGETRYETADIIVRDAFAATGSRYAIIATGSNYPDALAAGPAAGHLRAPVMLVNGQGGLDDATKATLAELDVTDVYIAGGTAVVSTSLETDLQRVLGAARVTRLAGVHRYETADKINEVIFQSSDFGFLASGEGYVDALAGGPLAAKLDAPLFLAPQNCVWGGSDFWIRARQIARLTLLGGTAVLSPRVDSLTPCP